MQWTDEGIVMGVRRHGEAGAIVELMTRTHGRHLGLVRGGAGSRLRPVLQPGNTVGVVWRARLDEHLGYYTVEGLRLRAADVFGAAHAVYGITYLAALVRLLPERDPHPHVLDSIEIIVETIEQPLAVAALMVRFELELLRELGFGLDLDYCAATGTDTDLIYVSPRSGRAVSRAAGEPWRDRLLPLPAFLSTAHDTAVPSAADVADGFRMTGFFLSAHIFDPRGLAVPPERERFIASALQGARTAPAA